jgi:hypothetical protein
MIAEIPGSWVQVLLAEYEYVFIRTEDFTAVVMKISTFLIISWLIFDSEDGGACSSETSVDFQRTTWRYIPADRTSRFFRFLLILFMVYAGAVYSSDYTEPDYRMAVNKKFWKELIAYFPLIRYRLHRKWRLQQFFYCCVCSLKAHYQRCFSFNWNLTVIALT